MADYILIILLIAFLVSLYRYINSLNIFRKIENKYNIRLKIFLKSILRTLIKQIRIVIVTYLGLIGLYIAMERIQKYQLFPYNIHDIKAFIDIILNLGANKFIYTIMKNYLPIYYIIFILPKDTIKLYDEWRALYQKEDVLVNMWDKFVKLIIKKSKTSKTYESKNDRNE